MSWTDEYWQSIKSFDTEEKLDLYFYRPVGFVIAKAAKKLHLTPDHLTYAGAILGIASGFFFANPSSTISLVIACVLLICAGLFDSSDGQLARMGGGKGSKFGLILDGFCDNIVFSSVYAGSIFALQATWGLQICAIGLIAGLLHSLESSALDYYNREYLYFGYGKVDSDYWNPSDAEAEAEISTIPRGFERLMMVMHLSWVWQQNRISTRSEKTREQWRSLARNAEFQSLYRDHNRFILRAWRLMGPNFHTVMIVIFTFLHRFDLYLVLIDILLLPLALLILRSLQSRADKHLIEALRSRRIG
jgi:hypothetical protein